MDVPPCIRVGEALNDCARRVYARAVTCHDDLTAEWSGWKLRGRVLISPEGDRITPARLRGMLFVESLRGRKRPPGRSGSQPAVPGSAIDRAEEPAASENGGSLDDPSAGTSPGASFSRIGLGSDER